MSSRVNWLIGLLFIFTGLAMAYFLGYQERRLGQAASEVPQPLSLQQLIDRGPNGNPHIEVSDFRLQTDAGEYVVVTHPSGAPWEQVFIPAVPSAVPAPAAYVVIHNVHLRDPDEVRELGRHRTLKGMVVNALGPLPARVKDYLAQKYPGIDPATCIVLEEGRTPPSASRAVAGWIGGLAFCTLGAIAIWRGRRIACR